MRFKLFFSTVGMIACCVLFSGCNFYFSGLTVYNLKKDIMVRIPFGRSWETLVRNLPEEKKFYTVERDYSHTFKLRLRDYSGKVLQEKKFFWDKVYYVNRFTYDFSPDMKKIVADCEKYEDIRLTDIDTGNEKVLIPKVNSVFSTVFFINSTQFILGTFKNEKYFGGKRGRLIKYDISNDRITEFPIPIEYQFGICGDLALSPSRRLMVVRYDLNSPFAIYDTRSCSLLKISKTHAYYSAFCFNSKDNQIALSDKNNIYTVDIETLKFTKIFTIPKKEVIYNIEYQDDLTIVIKSSVPAGYPKNIRFVDIRTKSLKRILKPDMNGQLYVTNEYLIFESL